MQPVGLPKKARIIYQEGQFAGIMGTESPAKRSTFERSFLSAAVAANLNRKMGMFNFEIFLLLASIRGLPDTLEGQKYNKKCIYVGRIKI